MTHQQNQIAGYSTSYFHPAPPPQNSQPLNNGQSNSRKRPRILGGMRARDSIEEKRIRITEENLMEAKKIKEATRVSKPHRALQTAYDPFMGNVTDSEKEEEAISDEEVAENVDPYYEDLSRKQDIMFQLSRLPPPRLGEDATAEIPEPKRVFIPVNVFDWPPLDALDGLEEAYAPGTSLSRQLAESFKETTPTQEQENVNKEVKKPTKSRRRRDPLKTISKKPSAAKLEALEPTQTSTTENGSMTSWFDLATSLTPVPSVFSGSDRFATQSPPSTTPVDFMRQDSVGSQSSTSSQGSSSAKRSKSKRKEIKEPPSKVSELENLDNLKIFLNKNAPSHVIDKENEELYRKKRGPENQPSELLVEMLKDANRLF
ncbi:unnamed protein product [Caenorhabditis brenneri]